jgi:hypothetical protein
VDFCAALLLNVTEVGARLHVAGLVAPEGEELTAHVSATAPVNVLDGVTVMVEVLPVAAPGATVTLPLLLRVNLLELPGGSQKCEHPVTKQVAARPMMMGAAISTTRLPMPIIIASPQSSSGKSAHKLKDFAWERV